MKSRHDQETEERIDKGQKRRSEARDAILEQARGLCHPRVTASELHRPGSARRGELVNAFRGHELLKTPCPIGIADLAKVRRGAVTRNAAPPGRGEAGLSNAKQRPGFQTPRLPRLRDETRATQARTVLPLERDPRAGICPGRGENRSAARRQPDSLFGIRIRVIQVRHLLNPDQVLPRRHQPAVGFPIPEVVNPTAVNIDVKVRFVPEIGRPLDDQVRIRTRIGRSPRRPARSGPSRSCRETANDHRD